MKGLIRNNFYAMESNLTISFILAAALAFTPLFIKNATIYPMIISIQVFLFVANTGASLRADEASKWNKFELTLPIKRSAMIGAKYVTFVIWMLFGFLMGVCTTVCIYLSGQRLDFSTILWGYEYGVALSMISIALMYPIILKIGAENNELVLILSAFAAIGSMCLVALALSSVTGGMNLRHPMVGLASIALSMALFALSFLASLHVHRNKEF